MGDSWSDKNSWATKRGKRTKKGYLVQKKRHLISWYIHQESAIKKPPHFAFFVKDKKYFRIRVPSFSPLLLLLPEPWQKNAIRSGTGELATTTMR